MALESADPGKDKLDWDDQHLDPPFARPCFRDAFCNSALVPSSGGGGLSDTGYFLHKKMVAVAGRSALDEKRESVVGGMIDKVKDLQSELDIIVDFLESGEDVDGGILAIYARLISDLDQLSGTNGSELARRLGFVRQRRDVCGVIHDNKAILQAIRGYLDIIFVEGDRVPDIVARLKNKISSLDDAIVLLEQLLHPVKSSPMLCGFISAITYSDNVKAMIRDRNDLTAATVHAHALHDTADHATATPPLITTTVLPLGYSQLTDVSVDVNRFNLPRVFRTIAANAIEAGAQEIKLSIEDAGEFIRIIISNSGAPIHEGDVDLLCEHHFSKATEGVYRHFGGWGEGLSTARDLIEQMGGVFERPTACLPKEKGGLGGAAFSFLLAKTEV